MAADTPAAPTTHQHSWRDAETVRVPKTSYSPVSVADHHYYTAVILVQSCECGAFRKVTLAHEDRRP